MGNLNYFAAIYNLKKELLFVAAIVRVKGDEPSSYIPDNASKLEIINSCPIIKDNKNYIHPKSI